MSEYKDLDRIKQDVILNETINDGTQVSLYRGDYNRLIVEWNGENSHGKVWLQDDEIAELLHYGMFMLQEKGEIDFMNEKDFPDYYEMYHKNPEWEKE